MLYQMNLAGCFEVLAGLILGDFEDCDPLDEIFRIVKNIFKGDGIPILAGFDCGHGEQNITIPFGLEASFDAENHMLSFHQTATMG